MFYVYNDLYFGIWAPSSLGCCPFEGGGSVVVDLLFNVLPIICGSYVFVFVLLTVALCPF